MGQKKNTTNKDLYLELIQVLAYEVNRCIIDTYPVVA